MPSNRINAAFTAKQREKAKAALATLVETLLNSLIQNKAFPKPAGMDRSPKPETPAEAGIFRPSPFANSTALTKSQGSVTGWVNTQS